MLKLKQKDFQERLKNIDFKLAYLLNQRFKIMDEFLKLNDNRFIANLFKDFTYLRSLKLSNSKVIFRFLEKLNEEFLKLHNKLYVSRDYKSNDTVINFKKKGRNISIGGLNPQIIAGPCSVESKEQLLKVAKFLNMKKIPFLRGGAFKPRTSPYDFQGLGKKGLEILHEVANNFNLFAVSEIMCERDLEFAERYLDIVQIGARNSQNFALLKAVGKSSLPVILKRGMSLTIEEFIYAAEYICYYGNSNVVLCERGIRTFEKATRNTLDIAAVPILKARTHLPVLVDISHATGRKDILLPCAQAVLAAGADGIMLEVHPEPSKALSDAKQQLTIQEFEEFLNKLKKV